MTTNGALIFAPDNFDPISFGSGISTTGSRFSSFVLQLGVYQINLSGTFYNENPVVPVSFFATLSGAALPESANWDTFNNLTGSDVPPDPFGGSLGGIIGGDRLIQVFQPNTILTITVNGDISTQEVQCNLIITQLQ
jgi:hypothetical protein